MSEKQGPTPGPWRYQEQADTYTHIVRGPNNVFITQLGQDTSGRAEADARLIAAGPALLAACKAALWLMGGDADRCKIGQKPCDPTRVPQTLREAIALAEKGAHSE